MKDSEFEQMAVRLRRKAMKASLAYGIGPMASEDIAQDVMLKLWVMRDEFASILPWTLWRSSWQGVCR